MVQKELMKDMNIDTVDDMIDEMQEMQYLTEEFSEAIQRNYEIDIDDEELNQGINKFILELDEIDREMKIELDTKALTVPNKRLISKKEQDEKELEEIIK